jgi:hypothetical protein
LKPNKQGLVLEQFRASQFGNKSSGATEHNHCINFRDAEYSEALLAEHLPNAIKGTGFASTWTSCNDNFIYGVLRAASEPVLGRVAFEI